MVVAPAIASHFSVDLTKNAKVRDVIIYNEADLITFCFSNDYGYEHWVC